MNDHSSGRPRRRDNSSFGERKGRAYRDGTSPGNQERRNRTDGPNRDANTRRNGGPRFENRRRGGRHDRQFRSNNTSYRSDSSRSSAPKIDEPAIPEDISPQDLDAEIRRDLRGLNKENADLVARHLVAAMWAIDDNPQLALRHGRAAKARAGRIGAVRELLGVLAYNAGEWNETLSELRAARRINGGPGLLALMADAERGSGRPERAIEMARSEEAGQLSAEDTVELRIVEAGARLDLDQVDAALVTIQDAGLTDKETGELPARLAYAYADILVAAGRIGEAKIWFRVAYDAEPNATDAADRIAALENETS